MKDFLYLPYYCVSHIIFLWNFYVCLIHKQFITVDSQKLGCFEGVCSRITLSYWHTEAMIFLYIILVIGCLVHKLANNFNLDSCQYSGTNRNGCSNVLATERI